MKHFSIVKSPSGYCDKVLSLKSPTVCLTKYCGKIHYSTNVEHLDAITNILCIEMKEKRYFRILGLFTLINLMYISSTK